jgi:RNA polymerase sigma factor (sigma-70 family)
MATPELKPSDVAAGHRLFHGRLFKRGFSLQFVRSCAEDLFAEGQLDVLRLMAEGREVYEPQGLLVHCAWRRTQKLVAKRARNPVSVTLEAVAEPVCPQATLDEEVISRDLQQRIRSAIAFLSPPDREMIKLIYFQGMSCRAAGRALGWGKSKADRKHQEALRRLRPFFGLNEPPGGK